MPLPHTSPGNNRDFDVTRTNAALLYHPDSFQIKRNELKGRHVASASFLEGFVRHSGTGEVIGAVSDMAFGDPFVESVTEYRADRVEGPMPQADVVSTNDHARLGEIGALFCADPMLSGFARRRAPSGSRSYSLCGITHTISSKEVQAGLASFLTAPLQPWDALICTSRSVRDVIEGMHQRYGERLAAVHGTRPRLSARLETIPLGLDAPFYARHGADGQARATLRAKLGVAEDDIVVLFLGRLAFHAKAHPYPMYVAMQRAQERLKQEGRQLHFLMTGQFANKHVGPNFRGSAVEACPNVPVHFIDGTPGPESWASWAAADIFLSLSDNIQESFGITPIEAMAAGLPCVVSDWDGYKDTIPDREVGFRVPTRMAPSGYGGGLAKGYAEGQMTYDRFIGTVCLMTEVEVDAAAQAIWRLAVNPEMRRRMGAAGQARAHTVYDWSVIVPRYQELWGELAQIRAMAEEAPAGPSGPPPVLEDPTTVFAGFGSQRIDGDLTVTAVQDRGTIETLLANGMTNFTPGLVLDSEGCNALYDEIMRTPSTLSDLATKAPANVRHQLVRTVIWMAKFGLVSFSH